MQQGISSNPSLSPNWRRSLVYAALTFIVIALVVWAASIWIENSLNAQTRTLVRNDLEHYRASLKSAINARLVSLNSLTAWAESSLATGQADKYWLPFATRLHSQTLGVRSIAIFRVDGNTFVFPTAENSFVVTKQQTLVPQTTQRNQLTISDPFAIAPGKLGIITQQPIIRDGKLIAIASLAFDVDSILDDIGIETDDVLNRFSSLRNENGSIIFGDPAGFTRSPITVTLPVADGAWEFASQPSAILIASNNLPLWLIRIGGIVVALMGATVVYVMRNRQMHLEDLVDARMEELAIVNLQLERDIAERKRTEQNLRESESQNRALLAAIPDLMYRISRERKYVGYQARDERDLPVPPSTFMYRTLDEVLPDYIVQQLSDAMERAFATSQVQVAEYAMPHHGETREFEARIVASRGDEALMLIRDITERKHAFQMLEHRVVERTRELSTLLEVSQQLVSTLELRPLLGTVLDQVEQLIGFDVAMILVPQGTDFAYLDYRGPENRDTLIGTRAPVEFAYAAQAVIDVHTSGVIGDLLGEDPSSKAFLSRLSPEMRQRYSGVRSALGVPMEVKEHLIGVLVLLHRLPNYYSSQSAQLATGLANQAAVAIENARLYEQAQGVAVLEERQRLARDLHDAVTQTLFSASLIAEVLPKLWHRNRAEAERRLEELRWFTRGALAEMRMLLLELRPTGLTDAAPADLLRQLAEAATARTRNPVRLQVQGEAILPPDVQITFYRIAQEALNNVWKHSDATEIRVSLIVLSDTGSTYKPNPNGARLDLASDIDGLGSGVHVDIDADVGNDDDDDDDNTFADNDNGRDNFEVDVRVPATSARMEVEDNGKGFDPQKVPANHFGLSIMRERAESIDAQLSVESCPGKGTKLTLIWSEHDRTALQMPTTQHRAG